MKNLVPHLWGLSFIQTCILLKVDRDGSMASSKAMIAGGVNPEAKRRCKTSIIDRNFHARPLAARSSSLLLKCRFLDRCMNRSRAIKNNQIIHEESRPHLSSASGLPVSLYSKRYI
ncbi:hypothetical protein PHMEG_00019857 [Phytophthora megakarya]|uniref:Uncharacterized protein n=1 Tax=Phytophthora megakarya TaxID=4795 RepID=A0A225VS38_9STRA|nr:hypothetical protein PHMEG_00019857 [Phytophthora megakarya]